MPCLELKLPARAWSQPATRLRSLLEKPGAAVLRRNHIAKAAGYDEALLGNCVRVTAVLAVDLTHPPQPDEPAEPVPSAESATAASADSDDGDALVAGFAKGLEVWIADRTHAVCVFADADEVTGALAMFDAYLRLARFQPAFERLDQRQVGLNFTFREGLALGIQGHPGESRPNPESFFERIAAIPEIEDSREPHFVVRLPNEGVGYFHELLRSASAWLEENSYTHILGSK
jgi:hypothetical protein